MDEEKCLENIAVGFMVTLTVLISYKFLVSLDLPYELQGILAVLFVGIGVVFGFACLWAVGWVTTEFIKNIYEMINRSKKTK